MDKKLKEYAALLIELGVNLQQGETLAIACPVECCDLAEEAARRGCKAALYGHTHRALISEENGVLLVNPGSLRYPAGEGGSYCYLTVNGDKIYPVLVGESVF
mgnify:CR=1 FL=1